VQYENFLLLIGAVFVPLFGVLAAHYAIVRRGYTTDDIYDSKRRFNAWGCASWLAGFLAYNWVNPGTVAWWTSSMHWLFETLLGGPKPPSWLGASLFSFAVALTLEAAQRLRRAGRSASRASAP
jgi:cytosine/uracil/thiamine/allantoin permease